MVKKRKSEITDEFTTNNLNHLRYFMEMPTDDLEVFGAISKDDGGVVQEPVVAMTTDYLPYTVATPMQAVDIQLGTQQWLGTLDGVIMYDKFLGAYFGHRWANDDDRLVEAQLMAYAMSDTMADAYTTFVTPDVSDVVQQLAKSMPPDMLTPEDLPYSPGFLLLGKPWPYMNYDDGKYVGSIPVRGVLWWEDDIRQPGEPLDKGGETWQNRKDMLDELGNPVTKPGIMSALFADWEWIESVRANKEPLGMASTPPLVLVDLIAWTYDTWWESVGATDPVDQHHQSPHIGSFRQQLLSLFRFMQEEIVVSERTRLPREARRRLQRSPVRDDDGHIQVVHLRRYSKVIKTLGQSIEDDEQEAKDMYWSHRWWRRGHDRTNWKTGIKDIRVRPHLVGPDDLPIKIHDRVVVSVDR